MKKQKQKPNKAKSSKVVKMNATVSKKSDRRVFSAQTKSEAVLSVWSERRKPREVCRELEISWTMLSQWQDRALTAMMTALEPKVRKEEDRGPALGPKLARLLQRKLRQRETDLSKVEQRLMKMQGSKEKVKA